eukprot:TRINITY_DN6279_c0_g1_i2.p1 TRINITY_DN6279_c0_g1~~TRINITY_DN6279_c0_g1_i2.p1  ORF type:complete len:1102 (+),score=274.52 TRINITY_DN6279_c0_g1_i2:489-3308(+)
MLYLSMFSRVTAASVRKKRQVHVTTRSIMRDRNKGVVKKTSRLVTMLKLDVINTRRYVAFGEAMPASKRHERLADHLVSLSCNLYSAVRKLSQGMADATMKFSLKLVLRCMPRLLAYLHDSDPKHSEKVTGAVFLLSYNIFANRIIESPRLLSQFLQAMFAAHAQDKPTVQDRISGLFLKISSLFYTPHFGIPPDQPLVVAGPATQGADTVWGEIPRPDAAVIEKARAWQTQEYACNTEAWKELLIHITKVGRRTGPMAWTYQYIAVSCTQMLLRDMLPPIEVPLFLLDHLTNDATAVQDESVTSLVHLLCLLKPPVGKKMVHLDDRSRLTPEDLHTTHRITSEKEWKETDFLDKNSFGWNQRPAQYKSYAEPGLTIAAEAPEVVTTRQAVLDKLMDSSYMQKVIDHAIVDTRTSSSGFSLINAHMWKGFFQIGGLAYFKSILSRLKKLCDDRMEEGAQCVASEICAGLLRGSKHWSYAELEEMWDLVLPVLDKALDATGPDSQKDWFESVNAMIYDRDRRRMPRFIDMILSQPIDTSLASVQQVKRLARVAPVLGELSWRGQDLCAAYLDKVEENLILQFKQTRQFAALGAATCVRSLHGVPSLPFRRDSAIDEQYEKGHPRLLQLFATFERKLTELAAEVTRCEQENAGNAEPSDTLTTARKNHQLVLELLLGCLTSCFSAVNSFRLLYPYLNPLIPHLARNADHSDEAVNNSVSYALACIAQCCDSIQHAESALNTLISAMEAPSTSWRAKITLFPVFQVFVHRFQIEMSPSLFQRLYSMVVDTLSDPNLEVRILGSTTLAGLFKIAAGMSEDKLDFVKQEADRFVQMARQHRLPSKKLRASEQGKLALRQRHAAVFALSGLIDAFPYTVPKWLAPTILAFADHISDPIPLSTTVKKTFSRFWNTHRDNWATAEKSFDSEQLHTLTQLLVSPSYYA